MERREAQHPYVTGVRAPGAGLATPTPKPARAGTPAPAHDRVLASPHARALATARGIDLESMTGSGPGGAVLAAAIFHFAWLGVQPAG